MKAILFRLITSVVIVFSTTNCTTVYDAYGQPREMVDPAAALVGAAAVGILAYGLANSGDCHRSNRNNQCYAPRAYNYRPYRGRGHYDQPDCGY